MVSIKDKGLSSYGTEETETPPKLQSSSSSTNKIHITVLLCLPQLRLFSYFGAHKSCLYFFVTVLSLMISIDPVLTVIVMVEESCLNEKKIKSASPFCF